MTGEYERLRAVVADFDRNGGGSDAPFVAVDLAPILDAYKEAVEALIVLCLENSHTYGCDCINADCRTRARAIDRAREQGVIE